MFNSLEQYHNSAELLVAPRRFASTSLPAVFKGHSDSARATTTEPGADCSVTSFDTVLLGGYRTWFDEKDLHDRRSFEPVSPFGAHHALRRADLPARGWRRASGAALVVAVVEQQSGVIAHWHAALFPIQLASKRTENWCWPLSSERIGNLAKRRAPQGVVAVGRHVLPVEQVCERG